MICANKASHSDHIVSCAFWVLPRHDLATNLISLNIVLSLIYKDFNRQILLFIGVYYDAWPCQLPTQSCLRDLIDVTLNDKESDSKVVNVDASKFGVGVDEELTIASMLQLKAWQEIGIV